MLASMKRYVDPGHAANLMTPHAAAIYDHITADMPMAAVFGLPVHTGDVAALPRNTCHFNPLLHQSAALPRALGQRQRNIGRIALAVLIQKHTRLDTLKV